MFEYGLYEENFELEVKRVMENLGYRVLHYVYVGYKGIISQIDLLAFGFGNVICIECKGMDLVKLNFSSRKKVWSYIDVDGREHTFPSARVQNINHIKVLKGYLLESGCEREVFRKYRIGIPRIVNVNVFKDSLDLTGVSDYLRADNGIFRVSDLWMVKDMNPVSRVMMPIREGINDIIYRYAEKNVDISDSTKKRHRLYIENCKKNHKGLFSGESVL